MGGIGIWCMHFIGNRAIVLDHGEADIQIVYNSGFTAISFFLPIGVLLAAFYLLGVTERRGWYYVTISGVLTGTAVCGMHYVGQLGIANYQCQYHVGNVIGAAVIAVFASLVALSVFFRFRATWTNSWWKRAFCASILAGAVSGMHWTATVGTDYKFKGRASSVNDALSRTQVVIICTVLVCTYSAFISTSLNVASGLRSMRGPFHLRHCRKPVKKANCATGTTAGFGMCLLRSARAHHGHSRRTASQFENYQSIR